MFIDVNKCISMPIDTGVFDGIRGDGFVKKLTIKRKVLADFSPKRGVMGGLFRFYTNAAELGRATVLALPLAMDRTARRERSWDMLDANKC